MAALSTDGILLGVHIAAGVVALVAGLGALSTEKGGDRHRRFGRFYVRSMAVVVGTVPLLLVVDPTDFVRQFLVLVAIFSGYLVFSGYRALTRKRPSADPERIDWVATGLVVLASLGLGGWGLALVLTGGRPGESGIGIVMAVFGVLGTGFGLADLRRFRTPTRQDPWVAQHLSRMIGGYIATVTAVSVVNLAGLLPNVVAWLWPTVVGVPLIWYFLGTVVDIGPLSNHVG